MVGGVLVSLGTALAGFAIGGVEVVFATHLRDVLLLVFFVTIGLSAKLGALRAGGRPLVLLCAVTVLLLVVQNVIGLLVARGCSERIPFMGLIAGSISFVGGPGTAMAWAQEARAMGLSRAPEVALAAATLAVVVGALVGRTDHGPVDPKPQPPRAAAWNQRALPWAPSKEAAAAAALPGGNRGPHAAGFPADLHRRGPPAIGSTDGRGQIGLVLPGFLTAMLAGVAITNVADGDRTPGSTSRRSSATARWPCRSSSRSA